MWDIKGFGFMNRALSDNEAMNIVKSTLDQENWDGKKVLLILPDATRSAPVGLLYRAIFEQISEKASCIDGLIALGTHQPMPLEGIFSRVDITPKEYEDKYKRKSKFFNHAWDDPDTLIKIGEIPAHEVNEITAGLMERKVEITINRAIFQYDCLLILGPVFPHEIVGFSGGNKYFFPGICGQDILDLFHWLGGLLTNAVINGTIDTPVRNIINRAAEFITIPRLYFNMVANHGTLHGLYTGDGIEAWHKAAELSAKVNIVYTGRKYKKVIGIAPLKYDELWTAGKVAYKAETIVEDGGELIIYAPHIKEISYTHGTYIRQVGYHVKDYFAKRMDMFSGIPEGILAHIVDLKGSGTYENDVESPRINVILATAIKKEECELLNLGYADPKAVNPSDWMGLENDDVFIIPDAGEVLYKV